MGIEGPVRVSARYSRNADAWLIVAQKGHSGPRIHFPATDAARICEDSIQTIESIKEQQN